MRGITRGRDGGLKWGALAPTCRVSGRKESATGEFASGPGPADEPAAARRWLHGTRQAALSPCRETGLADDSPSGVPSAVVDEAGRQPSNNWAATEAAAFVGNLILDECTANKRKNQGPRGRRGRWGADVRETGTDVRQQNCLPISKLDATDTHSTFDS